MGLFHSHLEKLERPIRILDVGGTREFWKENYQAFRLDGIHITLLNQDRYDLNDGTFTSVFGDVADLSRYDDRAFDVAFSNSVIEHLFTRENQNRMAHELRRVAKYYFVQTPNRNFFIEPHWMFPFFQFLPFQLRVWLTQSFALGHNPRLPERKVAEVRVREVRLITKSEFVEIFPDGELIEEKFMGFTKALIAHNFPV